MCWFEGQGSVYTSSNLPVDYSIVQYSETSLIQHSMGPENNVGLGGCWTMEYLLPYLRMYGDCTSYNGRIRMLDYRGVRLARFHCSTYVPNVMHTYTTHTSHTYVV